MEKVVNYFLFFSHFLKGAAVIKQLVAVIGEDAFKAGMIKYFKKFEYGNTTQEDFLR